MEPPPLIPERGEQFLPPPEGSSTFLDALIRSATHSEAQVFTEATPPFKICHANNGTRGACSAVTVCAQGPGLQDLCNQDSAQPRSEIGDFGRRGPLDDLTLCLVKPKLKLA